MSEEKKIARIRLLTDPWMRQQIAPYRRYFAQTMAIMAVTVRINFALPLTNRALVNVGILGGDAWFVDLIVALQVAMYLSLIVLNTVRSKISGHVSDRLVVRMTSEHVSKLVSMPMTFFRSSRSGEIVER